MYRRPPAGYTTTNLPSKNKLETFPRRNRWTVYDFIVNILCLVFFNMRNFLIHLLRCRVQLTLCLKRSEHDNLQTIRVVKYFILRAGYRLFELLEQKVNYCYIIYC